MFPGHTRTFYWRTQFPPTPVAVSYTRCHYRIRDLVSPRDLLSERQPDLIFSHAYRIQLQCTLIGVDSHDPIATVPNDLRGFTDISTRLLTVLLESLNVYEQTRYTIELISLCYRQTDRQ